MKGLGRKRCKEIVEGVLRASPADETQVVLSASVNALTRFANHRIHQNVTEEDVDLTVRVAFGRRVARATTNRRDPEAVRQVVERACELARFAPEQDRPSLPGSRVYPKLQRYDAPTARLTPYQRAKAVKAVVAQIKARSLNSAGFLSDSAHITALANSGGLFAFDRHTEAEFSVTVMAEDSSGWAKAAGPGIGEFQLEALTGEAVEKALKGRNPRDVEPGRYTVVLAPAAVADLLGFLAGDFGALSVHLQQSCLTGKLGARLFGENVSIADHWEHPLQMGLSFDGDGLPRRRVDLVEKGVVRDLVCSLSTAKLLGRSPTGHGLFDDPDEFPMNLVMEGGEESIEGMVRATRRGLLVTRFWYIREVDPAKKILTGMTRDGTFYIEDGEVRHGVKNLRFNQGLIEMLNQVEALGRPVRSAGEEHFGCLVVPPLRVGEFHFTGKTLF